MALELARISAAQLKSLDASRTAFFFAVGPIEDHGPHLPLGLDLLEASELCRRAAERLEREMPGWTAVLMPAAPLSIDSNTGRLALTVRPHVLRDWLVDACRGLVSAGFFHFVCYSGHPGPKQLTAIEEAGTAVYRATRWIRLWRRLTGSGKGPLPALVSATSAQIPPSLVWRSPIFADPSEHGGRRDASVALALDPALVDPAHAQAPAAEPPHPKHLVRLWMHWRRAASGYWGKPAEGGAAWGQSVLQGALDETFPKIRAMLEGADPQLLFRSWYSVIPSNRSFFKSWILALGLLAILMSWVLLNLWSTLSG